MRLFVAILFSLVFFSQTRAQNGQFEMEIESALAVHDTASSVASEMAALEAFRELTTRYQKEWLPPYWTAYLCTQVARLKGRASDFPVNLDPKALIDEAQEQFHKANARTPDKDDILKSDFHMLQGFIYGWREWITASSEEEKEKYRAMRQAEYDRAMRLNPENPLMYVMVGIQLQDEPRDHNDALAAVALLNYAEEIFSRAARRSLTTYWNRDFIPYWRSEARKKLDKLLNEKKS